VVEGRFRFAKFPIISADLGSANLLNPPEIRLELSAFFQIHPNAELCPESPVLLIITTIQEILSGEGGVLATDLRAAQEASRDLCESETGVLFRKGGEFG
jgi:hypothetical protein